MFIIVSQMLTNFNQVDFSTVLKHPASTSLALPPCSARPRTPSCRAHSSCVAMKPRQPSMSRPTTSPTNSPSSTRPRRRIALFLKSNGSATTASQSTVRSTLSPMAKFSSKVLFYELWNGMRAQSRGRGGTRAQYEITGVMSDAVCLDDESLRGAV